MKVESNMNMNSHDGLPAVGGQGQYVSMSMYDVHGNITGRCQSLASSVGGSTTSYEEAPTPSGSFSSAHGSDLAFGDRMY